MFLSEMYCKANDVTVLLQKKADDVPAGLWSSRWVVEWIMVRVVDSIMVQQVGVADRIVVQ